MYRLTVQTTWPSSSPPASFWTYWWFFRPRSSKCKQDSFLVNTKANGHGTFRQQWMFVTDTIDAVYRPEEWSPESLLDQLAEMVAELPDSRVSLPIQIVIFLY